MSGKNEHIDDFSQSFKKSFEQESATPPDGAWDDLSAKFSQIEDEAFDAKVKNILTANVNPPANLWKKIDKATSEESHKLRWGFWLLFGFALGTFGTYLLVQTLDPTNDVISSKKEMLQKKKEVKLPTNNSKQEGKGKNNPNTLNSQVVTEGTEVVINRMDTGTTTTKDTAFYNRDQINSVSQETDVKKVGIIPLNVKDDSLRVVKELTLENNEIPSENKLGGSQLDEIDASEPVLGKSLDKPSEEKDKDIDDPNTTNKNGLGENLLTKEENNVSSPLNNEGGKHINSVQTQSTDKDISNSMEGSQHSGGSEKELLAGEVSNKSIDEEGTSTNEVKSTTDTTLSIAQADSLPDSTLIAKNDSIKRKKPKKKQKKTKQDSVKKWMLTAYAVPGFHKQKVTQHDSLKNYFDSLHVSKLLWSFEAGLTYNLKNNFQISLGVGLTKFSHQYNKTAFGYEDEIPMESNTENGIVVINGLFGDTKTPDLVELEMAPDWDLGEFFLGNEWDYSEKLDYTVVNVPIDVKWVPGSYKIKPLIKLGGELVFITNAKSAITLTVLSESTKVENYAQLKRVNFAGSIGVGTQIDLTKSLGITLLPSLNYQFSEISKNSKFQFTPYSIRLYSGIYYRL